MSQPLYYVLREGLARGQGRYYIGGFPSSGRPRLAATERHSVPLHKADAQRRARVFTARGFPMRVVAIVSKR
jgi:hypothetical protein